MQLPQRFCFDKEDYELLALVTAVPQKREEQEHGHERFFDAALHPHGIKSMSSSREMRVAHAVMRLLDSLEAGQSTERLLALRVLYDEVLNSSTTTTFRRNTARVLIEIAKELVRNRGNELRSLMLAHDFRKAASGNTRIVRGFLERYHLTEMPEDWSQLSFDHHVHDANTKGRKNPTHLIMDAWIKGIRYLTIIYYNHVHTEAARETLHAASIVGIHVRIGFEYSAPFHGRSMRFVFTPHGFSGEAEFLEFLNEPPTRHLMRLGREVSDYYSAYVFALLETWNVRHKEEAEHLLCLPIEPLVPEKFRLFVGIGEASLQHLAEFIVAHCAPLVALREAALQDALRAEHISDDERSRLVTDEEHLDALSSVTFVYKSWLSPEADPDLPTAERPAPNTDVPDLLKLAPHILMDWVTSLRAGSRITLNLSTLTAADVLELLWTCQGMITHLELYNSKEATEGKLAHIRKINQLQRAINSGSAPRVKQIIRTLLCELDGQAATEETQKRQAMFSEILRNIPILCGYYAQVPLRVYCGTDSTSRSDRSNAMGMVFVETLTARGRDSLKKKEEDIIPVHIDVRYIVSIAPSSDKGVLEPLYALLRRIPCLRHVGYERSNEWVSQSSTAMVTKDGNIASLGKRKKIETPRRKEVPTTPEHESLPLFYGNTLRKNIAKVVLGFIPAVIAFQLTQSWWVLAYFGAFIWFAITGVRNILQFIISGRGLRVTSMLCWKDFIDWSRLADSLLYTGFSVLLIEYFVRYLLLQESFSIGAERPFIMYSVLAVANGLYLYSHNMFRGLPRSAAVGNLFRSVLAIPLAVLYNIILFYVLQHFVPDPTLLLTPSAAIISKCAGDTVAAWIEGFADSANKRRMRQWDMQGKLRQIFACYTQIELLFPEKDSLELLCTPKAFLKKLAVADSNVGRECIIHALDMMYFWLYLPRGEEVLAKVVAELSSEERLVLARMQLVLQDEKAVCELFINGLVGNKFSQALAFYLNKHESYISYITELCFPKGENSAQ